jgi:hypothetical protein
VIRELKKREEKRSASWAFPSHSITVESVVLKLVNVTEVGDGNRDTNKDGADQSDHEHELQRADVEIRKAELKRLEAEARLLDDVGSYYKGLAAREEAEADIAIVEKDRAEEVFNDPRVKKLLRAEKVSELVRNIRRNRSDSKPRRNERRAGGPQSSDRRPPFRNGTGGRGGRVDQRTPPESVAQTQPQHRA